MTPGADGKSEVFAPIKSDTTSLQTNLPGGEYRPRESESHANLECINLPGVSLPRTAALDRRVARRLSAVIEDLQSQGIKISFTWGFRTTCQQRQVNSGGNLKARPGTSPHEAGRAVDVNGILKRPDSSQIIATFQKYGWVWLGPKDPPHFEIKGFTVNEASHLQWIEKIQQDFQAGQPASGCRGPECGS
jgi:LAS superfamily LD-carboxypeptidase LdcB